LPEVLHTAFLSDLGPIGHRVAAPRAFDLQTGIEPGKVGDPADMLWKDDSSTCDPQLMSAIAPKQK
jgi:hypothetical protein